MLCDRCSNIDFDQLLPTDQKPGKYEHCINYQAMQAAALEGCELCSLVVTLKERYGHPTPNNNVQIFVGMPPLKNRGDDTSRDNELAFYSGPSKAFNNTVWIPRYFFVQLDVFIERKEDINQTSMVCPKLPRSVTDLIKGRPLLDNLASEDCFELAREWLNHCRGAGVNGSKHQICQIPVFLQNKNREGTHLSDKAYFVPSRTLDLGALDELCDPRLVCHDEAGNGPAKDFEWVTLSHRWGSLVPLMTTLSSFEDRMRSIPLTSLPPTFHDAVIITKKLGFRHLWIDSLCIIQDSEQDWTFESLRMSNVYGNAVLNISAASAKDSDAGILIQRSLNCKAEIVKVPLKSLEHNVNGSMYVRPALADWVSTLEGDNPSYFGKNKLATSILSSRAWVLQESLMSPRTLHFCREQMIWECREMRATEGSLSQASKPQMPHLLEETWSWPFNKQFMLPPLQVSPGTNQSSISGRPVKRSEFKQMLSATCRRSYKFLKNMQNVLGRKYSTATTLCPELSEHTIQLVWHMRWYTILEKYSKRNLTYNSDILPAVAGLASIVHFHLKDNQYYAGLFSGDLLRGFTWHVDERHGPGSRLEGYYAPSWSWASVAGRKTWDSCPDKWSKHIKGHRAEIVHIHVTPEARSTGPTSGFGRVLDGHVIIRGRFRTIKSWPKIDRRGPNWRQCGEGEEDTNLRCYFDVGVREDYISDDLQGEEYGFLQLDAWEIEIPAIDWIDEVQVLIVEPKTALKDQWRRIGFAHLYLENQREHIESWEMRDLLIV